MLYSETCLFFPFVALVQKVSEIFIVPLDVYFLTTIDTRLTIKEMFQNKEQQNLQNFDLLLYMVLFIILCSVSELSSVSLTASLSIIITTTLCYWTCTFQMNGMPYLYFILCDQSKNCFFFILWGLQKKCKLIIFVVSFQWNVIITHTKK